MDVVPNSLKCPVPRAELTEVYGTGIYVVPKIPKCPIPVSKSVPVPALPVSMSNLSYRSVWCRYWCTALTEVVWMFVATLPKLSGTLIVVPNLPKWYGCRIDLTEVVRYRGWCAELAEQSSTGITGGMSRYVPYRTHPFLHVVQKVPFGLSTDEKSEN